MSETKDPSNLFHKSAIIVAHPDDEALWFSSLLSKVEKIIICFLNYKTKHQKSRGRQRALSEFPIKNMTCLGLGESDAFWETDWHNPETTPFGMQVNGKNAADYRNNYYKLKESLGACLEPGSRVFTHNAWGEYGHNEHVQVYRVLKDLQSEMHFDLWCSNYCSNKSLPLMAKCNPEYNGRHLSFNTDKQTAHSLKVLYEKNGCWSWFRDHEWLDEESFLHGEACGENSAARAQLFPLNFIRLDLDPRKPPRRNRMAGILEILNKKFTGE
jgi:hypothetical protein